MKDETKQTEIHAFIFQNSYRKNQMHLKRYEKSPWWGWVGGGATGGSW